MIKEQGSDLYLYLTAGAKRTSRTFVMVHTKVWVDQILATSLVDSPEARSSKADAS